MQTSSKIFIAGHNGLVGSALARKLREKGFTNLVERTRKELDLTNQHAVEVFFAHEKPEYVFLAAAKVGGIHANSAYPAEFIFSNMQVQMNIINESSKHKVKKMLFWGHRAFIPNSLRIPTPAR
jgi:GDP-L-fucose synthase